MGVPGPNFGGWLRGRSNRQQYWLIVGALVAVGTAATYLPPILNLGTAAIMAGAQVRRLHDIGRSGWWAAAFLGAQVALAVGLYALLNPEEEAVLIGSMLILVPVAWLGAIPGQPHENRFGPPPGRRSLKDVFS